MISVSIFINGNPILTRSAKNLGTKKGEEFIYLADDGSYVFHNPKDGAIELSKKLLDLIKEP